MGIKNELLKKEKIFVEKWFQAVIETYPEQSAKAIGKESNQFANPVGSVTRQTIENVFTLITRDYNLKELENTLDPIIRIRSVQAFSASEAVSFVFALKDIGEKLLDKKFTKEFNRIVDNIALASFNRFVKCKEEIYLLKANEGKRRVHKAFERAGLVDKLEETKF